MESSPAQHSREREAQEHRVQENESTDRGIGVLAEHHKRDEPYSRPLEVELAGGVVGQGDRDGSKESIECSHHCVVQLFRVRLPRFEFKRSIVACEVPRQPNQHLSEGRMHIEIEFALEVVRTEFPKAVVQVNTCL